MNPLTQEQIREGNKLIAAFIGVDVDFKSSIYGEVWKDSKSCLRHFIDNRPGKDGFLFHSSFDWLLPVVHKLSAMWDEALEEQDEDRMEQLNEVLSLGISTPIETVWQRVLDFIEWYNRQSK